MQVHHMYDNKPFLVDRLSTPFFWRLKPVLNRYFEEVSSHRADLYLCPVLLLWVNPAIKLPLTRRVPNVGCLMFAGQIQEEEEKETQEAWQKKEKEGGISVRLGVWLTTINVWFSHPHDSQLVIFIFRLKTKVSPIQLLSSCLSQEACRRITLQLVLATIGTYRAFIFITILFVEFFFLSRTGLELISSVFFLSVWRPHASIYQTAPNGITVATLNLTPWIRSCSTRLSC